MGDEDWMGQILTPVAEPPADAFEQSDRRSQRRWLTGFAVAGLVTGAAAVIGFVGPAVGYLLLDPLTRHVDVLLMASLALLIVAAIVMPPLPTRGNVLRVLVVIGLGFGLAAVAVNAALLSFGDGETRAASPDGRSIVVVREVSGDRGDSGDSDEFDTVWIVTVQQSSPLLARTWNLACYNGDGPDNTLDSIRWVSSTVVEVKEYSGQTFQVTIDPNTSQPSTTISSGCSG